MRARLAPDPRSRAPVMPDKMQTLVLVLALAGCGGGDTGHNPTPDAPAPDSYKYQLDIKVNPSKDSPQSKEGPAPPDGPRPDGSTKVVFWSDFESNNGYLSGTGDWEWGTYTYFTDGTNCSPPISAPLAPHSGSKMWGTKLNSCFTPAAAQPSGTACTDPTGFYKSVLTLNVNLSSLKQATLTFWTWEEYVEGFDWAEIRVNNTVVKQYCKSGDIPSTPTWTQRSLPLSSYVGSPAVITFLFHATDQVNESGWYIDDVKISGQ